VSCEANYVDNIHLVTREKDEEGKAHQECAQMKLRMNLLGDQADDQKYRLPNVTPGAWNGVIIHTDTPFLMMSTTLKNGPDSRMAWPGYSPTARTQVVFPQRS
jgi:hypothetical protein